MREIVVSPPMRRILKWWLTNPYQEVETMREIVVSADETVRLIVTGKRGYTAWQLSASSVRDPMEGMERHDLTVCPEGTEDRTAMAVVDEYPGVAGR